MNSNKIRFETQTVANDRVKKIIQHQQRYGLDAINEELKRFRFGVKVEIIRGVYVVTKLE